MSTGFGHERVDAGERHLDLSKVDVADLTREAQQAFDGGFHSDPPLWTVTLDDRQTRGLEAALAAATPYTATIPAPFGGGRQCQADRGAVGDREKFRLEHLGGGRVALRTAALGRYVSVQP
ncbi:hypothetical protein [Frankia sp. AgB32]|uniref:fascin domain-containing protein n=1 Tax=Frankia sp. AgB32 TaxID=631119 RepID=UPI00200CF08E|nr:hypothetical protein [Frankia sp. AgB32]MCK9896843.1 hypothetical protein [Frankia sp. AgB32]